jgi:hypothetical protein
VLLLVVLPACARVEAADAKRVFLPVGDRLVPPTATATATRTRTPTGGERSPTRTAMPSRTPRPAATPTETPAPSLEPPTPFPTGLATMADPIDSFDRAESSDGLGRAPNDALWQSDGSSWGICAGQACARGPADSSTWVRIHSRHADVRASLRISPRPLDADGAAGLGLRVGPEWWSHIVYVGLDPRGYVEVWTLVDSLWSNGPIDLVATAFNGRAARVLEARLVGTSLDVYVDSARVLTNVPVPPAPPGSTWVAMFAHTTDPDASRWPRLDDFSVGAAP